MSRARTERLLNLLICLLATRRYLTKSEIRAAVPGYSESTEAFERAFERDKEELREMGVPVETGSNDALFEDEVGYRVRRDAYALPEVRFAADEMAVLALAARAWQQATLAGAASAGLRKLQAYGVDVADVSTAGVDPRVDAHEAAFLPLWHAVSGRYPVRFAYRRGGAPTAEERLLEPWGIVSWHGRWYVVGHDRHRGATRVFRLSRIEGEVTRAGEPGEVTVPEGLDVRAQVPLLAEPVARGTARVRLRAGSGGFLRRHATAVEPLEAGWDLVGVPFTDPERFAGDVAGLGAAAVVESPGEVRAAVVARLAGALGEAER